MRMIQEKSGDEIHNDTAAAAATDDDNVGKERLEGWVCSGGLPGILTT